MGGKRSHMVFRSPPLCALCASVRDSSYFRKFSHKCRPGNPTRRNPGPRIISRQVRRARQVVPVESPPGPPDAKDNGLIAFLADENTAKTARGQTLKLALFSPQGIRRFWHSVIGLHKPNLADTHPPRLSSGIPCPLGGKARIDSSSAPPYYGNRTVEIPAT